jgi:hypothetical protein
MFKCFNKITSYGDELRIDLNLNKRQRNYRFKNKVLYIKDKLIFCKDKDRFYYKYKYVVNDKIYCYPFKLKKNNILHRNHDTKIACDFCSKSQKQRFCDDKPAIILSNGNQYWYYQGKAHREGDKPAVICLNGDQYWYSHGDRHRENDLPAVIRSDGYQTWYKNGVFYTP